MPLSPRTSNGLADPPHCGADLSLRKEDITIAESLTPLGYATGQFGKNHLGYKNEFLPTAHGLDEFFVGNLYHLSGRRQMTAPMLARPARARLTLTCD